ncbi:MAG: zinc ABC transporter substrate-binding protein [Clostridia bacterium]|nr:zinc ABC transporter substrate-binding protein [Clostridia bacterium]
MKKILLLLLTLLLLPALFSCAEEETSEITVIASNFSAYDFALEIVGRDNPRVKVEFLPAGDAHSFNPTFKDVARISSCDLFLYIGGQSDTATASLIGGIRNLNAKALIDTVTLLEEGGHDHDHAEEETVYDEHIWTSPKNAALMVNAIYEEIVKIDEDYAETYKANRDAYLEKLAELDSAFEELIAAQTKTVIFGDRFPLIYFAEAYGMRYEAAFPSCQATAEPSPNRIAELIETVKREGISTVFHIEGAQHTVADRIAEETDTATALFHACHKVSEEEIRSGTTYLSLMQENYTALQKALS